MRVIPNCLIPFKGFWAINLFGVIFVQESKESWEITKTTYRGKVMLNHERIHSMQAQSFKTKWIGFYIAYLGCWIKNLFIYGCNLDAYYNIPFEREAFNNEHNFNYRR